VIGKDVSIAGRCAIVDVTHPYEDINAGRIGSLIADNDSYVEVGDGAFLGYGAVILPNVRIGKRAVIGANAVVTHDVPEFSVVAGAPAKVMKVYSKKLQQWVKPVPQSDWSSG
jgi:acetyltransferase-like isoleucine patch superfamily enzyme